jgi:hypothetical protein
MTLNLAGSKAVPEARGASAMVKQGLVSERGATHDEAHRTRLKLSTHLVDEWGYIVVREDWVVSL